MSVYSYNDNNTSWFFMIYFSITEKTNATDWLSESGRNTARDQSHFRHTSQNIKHYLEYFMIIGKIQKVQYNLY